ncbi:MAG: alcohol dehydrogenase catalytic domain-containing protein [bacterium]
MIALTYKNGKLELNPDFPDPTAEGEALIKVRLAGICRTDLEIIKGYMGFSGVLGHEFVGEVVESPDSEWIGKRVVGEISCGCGKCEYCKSGCQRHCPKRSVLGLLNRDGCMAEYVSLPLENLYLVPGNISDEEAVFTEPVAAACRIAEQVNIEGKKILVIGDGKLGLIIAQVLHALGGKVLAQGKHQDKLALLQRRGIAVVMEEMSGFRKFEIVVEASGSRSGLSEALEKIKPLGTLVMKTTVANPSPFQTASLVTDEIKLIGSRCGPFPSALKLLSEKRIAIAPLIDFCYPLSLGIEAFNRAKEKDSLKVLLKS